MTVVFIISIAILVHTYIGYPLSLLVWRLVRGDLSRHATQDITPTITLVISAYNEEKVIREKLLNTLDLDYPPAALRIVVVSDGSTDATEAIVNEFSGRGVELRAFPGRQGKVGCLNQVIPTLTSELVVMSDSNSMYARDSLRTLSRHFVDPRIGCVCGQLRYVNPRRLSAGEGERLYWMYEGMIKSLESASGSLLGANGAIYAYRTEHFRSVDPLMFCDDLIPIRIAVSGLLTIYDPQAWCTEETPDERVQRTRRSRHASFGLRSMLLLIREALAQGRFGVAYQCVSHRVLRWAGGLALAGMLFSSPFLPHPWRAMALSGQAVLYLSALLGLVAARSGWTAGPLYLPYYYLVITLAGVHGLWNMIRKKDRPFWEPRQ